MPRSRCAAGDGAGGVAGLVWLAEGGRDGRSPGCWAPRARRRQLPSAGRPPTPSLIGPFVLPQAIVDRAYRRAKDLVQQNIQVRGSGRWRGSGHACSRGWAARRPRPPAARARPPPSRSAPAHHPPRLDTNAGAARDRRPADGARVDRWGGPAGTRGRERGRARGAAWRSEPCRPCSTRERSPRLARALTRSSPSSRAFFTPSAAGAAGGGAVAAVPEGGRAQRDYPVPHGVSADRRMPAGRAAGAC